MDVVQSLWEMIDLNLSVSSLGYWNYLIIALLVAIEGPAATLMAAAMAGSGLLAPWLVFAATMLGNASADAAWFVLGYIGHFERWLRRFPWLRQYEHHVERLKQGMNKHGVKLILIAKLSLGMAMIPTLIAAGAVRIDWRKLLPISLLGEAVWTGTLVLLGYYLGERTAQMQAWLQSLAVGGGIAMALIVLTWLSRRMQERQPTASPVPR